MSQQLFGLIDQDSDGSVTKTELQSLSGESSSVIDNFVSKVDASDDQAITQQEFASALAKLFQEMQSNSADNMSAGGPPPPPPPKDSGQMFTSLDSNGDGSLTVDELTAGGVPDADKLFSEIDTDSDGKITETESDAFDQKMKANESQAMTAAPPPPKDSGAMFTSLDSNGDASLTVDELTAGGVPDADKLFSEIDTDGDGKITETESDAFAQKMETDKPQSVATEDTSVSLSSLQVEFLDKLMEMIAQNQSYLDLTTKTNSVVA